MNLSELLRRTRRRLVPVAWPRRVRSARAGASPRWRLVAAVACVMMLLGACADDATERRFANEPLPTVEVAESTPIPTPAAASPVPVPRGPAAVSPEALLDARGAPRHFYVIAENRLLAFAADGSAPTVVLDERAGEIQAVSASPNGDRVAALLVTDGAYLVVVLDAAGKELHRIHDLQPVVVAAQATPVAGGQVGRDLVDWSPQGDKILVAFSAGGIMSIPLDGEPTVVVSPEQASGLRDAEWSPAGNAIAYVSRPPGASGAGLFLVNTDGTEREPVALVAPPTGRGSSVVAIAWHPNGRSVLYTRTGPTGNDTLGGDLFQIVLGGGRQLIASSGKAGPVTGIIAFAPSPDGRAVAYVIAIPGEQGPTFHSLWLKQLGAENEVRLPTGPDMAVSGLWWTAGGLVWQGVPGRTIAPEAVPAEFGLYLAQPSDVVAIYENLPAATPEAAAVASPVASPAATPFPDE